MNQPLNFAVSFCFRLLFKKSIKISNHAIQKRDEFFEGRSKTKGNCLAQCLHAKFLKLKSIFEKNLPEVKLGPKT